MNSVVIPKYGKVYRRDIGKREFDKLRNELNGEYIEAYSNAFSAQVYKLNDGSAIVERNDYYTFYQKFEGLIKVFENFNFLSRPIEILYGRNPYGASFPHHTQHLISELLNQLGLGNKELSQEILRQIDDSINTLQGPDDFRDNFFLNQVALIGELLIKNKRSKWKMDLSEDHETWNTNLVYKSKTIVFVSYLFEDMFTNKFPDPLTMTYSSVTDIIDINLK